MPNLASFIPARIPQSMSSSIRSSSSRRNPARLAASIAGAVLIAGCVIPPGAATIPASGVAGQRRAGMTSARKKGENPFQDAYWVLDPDSAAHRTAEQWRATRPADAAALDKIAGQPAAAWMGNWFPQIELAVKTYVWSRTRAGGLPVMILYNLPFRDCGGYSAGGAGSIGGYHTWIDGVAKGIGSRRAVVVLEPDGLPLMSKCLDAKRRDERVAMIRYAVEKLTALPGSAVYLDAGHSAWLTAAEIAPRLKAAGIDRADGFSLNVSNYQATPDLLKYGHEISALLGGKHFIIDTGRNGNGAPQKLGPDDERAWCNPDGRALGTPPTTNTGDPLCDAFYWLKPPGESDGRCNKGPAAGAWWPQKALEMARAAKW
jgi:endoglucanase